MYLCVVLRVQQQHLRAAGLRCARSACFSFSFSIILESCTVVADTTNCLVVFNTFIRSNHKVPPQHSQEALFGLPKWRDSVIYDTDCTLKQKKRAYEKKGLLLLLFVCAFFVCILVLRERTSIIMWIHSVEFALLVFLVLMTRKDRGSFVRVVEGLSLYYIGTL